MSLPFEKWKALPFSFGTFCSISSGVVKIANYVKVVYQQPTAFFETLLVADTISIYRGAKVTKGPKGWTIICGVSESRAVPHWHITTKRRGAFHPRG